MRKEILIALTFAGLLLITPLTGIAQENKITTESIAFETDFNNPEELVAQLRVVIDEILEKYGHIPMVRGLCNVILNTLGLGGKILYCIVIIIIAVPLVILYTFFGNLGLYIVSDILTIIVLTLIGEYEYNCPPSKTLSNYLSPLESLYTLSKTKDIPYQLNDCPCLQE